MLDRRRIGMAALRMADEQGVLTIPGLAKVLDVAPSALYHHVKGRAEIIALMREELARETDINGPRFGTWREVVEQWARAYLEAFAAHPGSIQIMATAPLSEPFMHRMYDSVAEQLSTAGFPVERVMPLIAALENFVLGSALDLVAPAVMLSEIDRDATPHLSAALEHSPPDGQRARRAFDAGLEVMLTGLEALLSKAQE
ncbi:TetR/AcrR family transcriptional regulator C-terminal domain-containing protein [Streptomyces adustus]|uniref:TetR/AcrR family transcriptional regulator C-terminal domain-containing protein n=1 Tax=Streptomyces adustus TaxID=1609272 RepID=UPI0037165D3D